jgi:Fe-S cluster assembly protein SufD
LNVAALKSDQLQALVQAHARSVTALPGGAEWNARRIEALERFVTLGLPTQRDDSWKYSPLRLLEKRLLQLPQTESTPLATDAVESSRLNIDDVRTLVFANGRLLASLSDSLDVGPGTRCEPLAAALSRTPRELLDRVAIAGDSADDRLALLNLAFLADGAAVSVSENVTAPTLYLIFVSSGSGRVCHPRLLIDVGAHAKLKIIEHHIGHGEDEALSNCVTDIRLDDGAELEHVVLVEGGRRSIVLNSLCAQASSNSRLAQYRVLISGLYGRASLHAALVGRDSAVETNSLVLADQRKHLEVLSVIEHRTGHTRSTERFRGIANDRGRGVFNGRIVVQPGAAKSESQQSSRALLLSEQAEVYARPQLEILTDDVKCSHGATTGRLDPNMLFYLLSRGIDAETARALLIRAFLADALAHLHSSQLRLELERRITRALPRSQQLGDLT